MSDSPIALLRSYARQAPWNARGLAAQVTGLVDAAGVRPTNASARAAPSARSIRFYVANHLLERPEGTGTSATYNYSLDPAVNDITSTLQKLSAVLEYGRRLSWFEKYQKLALEDDLKAMEDRQRQDYLGDVRAIAPLLKKIAYDQSVMRMTRARALRLLATVGQ